MAIKKTLTILEEIDTLTAEAESLHVVAKDEKRDLNEDEFSRWSAITDKEKGELFALDAELVQAKKYEDAQLALANRIASPAKQPGNDGASLRPVTDGAKPKVALPNLFHSSKLTAFKGPEARETAYKCGAHIAASIFGNAKAREVCDGMGLDYRAAMTEGSNLAGGYLVLPEFDQTVIDLRIEYGVFGQHVKRRPMSSDQTIIPRRASGLTAYAVGENEEIIASDKGWSQVEIIPKKWGVLCKYSTELAEDAFIDLANDLAEEMAYALVIKEDQSGFIGDGTSTYHGITGVVNRIDDGNHAGSIFTAADANTTYELLDYKDFRDTVQELPNFPGIKRVWHCHRVAFYQAMDRLAEAAGGNTRAAVEDGPSRQFMGYPVVFNEVMNSTTGSNVGNIGFLFGDLGAAATFGMRRGLAVSSTTDRYFELDQIGIKGTTRWGISVHDVGDSNDAGPVVAMKFPAS